MAEQPDYTQAGDIYKKSMEEFMANLDKVNEDLKKEQEKAIDMQIAAQDEFKRIQREAHQISEAYMEQHRKEYLALMKNQIFEDVLKKLILNEVPSDKLVKWLEVPPDVITDVWFDLGFEKLGEIHIGHVSYEGKGRSGHVIFYRNDVTLRFPFEFAGGNALSIVEVPTVENWEKETKLPLSDRQVILEFVANRIIRNQAPKCTYLMHPDHILITY